MVAVVLKRNDPTESFWAIFIGWTLGAGFCFGAFFVIVFVIVYLVADSVGYGSLIDKNEKTVWLLIAILLSTGPLFLKLDSKFK